MPESHRLREVFTPGGLPSVTYVSLDHLDLENKVREGLARGFAFFVVTGPTKSGKSVLCSKVLGAERLISVEGGQIRSESDFWNHIAFKLNIASGSSKSEGSGSSATFTGEASGGIPALIQGKGAFAEATSDQKSSTL